MGRATYLQEHVISMVRPTKCKMGQLLAVLEVRPTPSKMGSAKGAYARKGNFVEL